MTALEMQFAALHLSRRALSKTLASPAPDSLVVACGLGVDYLPTCSTFSWSNETANAVQMASRSIPATTIVPTLGLPEGAQACWWWFESPLTIWSKDAAGGDNNPEIDRKRVIAMLCVREADGIILMGYRWWQPSGYPDHVPMPGPIVALKPGTRLCDIETDAKETTGISYAVDAIRFFLAACAWFDQRIISLGSGHIERHRRKQLAREINSPVPSEVKVVQLRRFESQPHQEGNAEPVDWSCRWIVNGHWRNQPYANGEHKLIYIMPFVKGPEDKPLRVPAHTVYSVNR
jgi:hypothetical protein